MKKCGKNAEKQQKESIMEKQDLTNDEQMVLSYLIIIDGYVKRNNNLEDEEKSFYEQFLFAFDALNNDEQRLFYENLISLNEKNYINFEGDTYISDNDFIDFEGDTYTSDNDYTIYDFNSIEICKKGMDYGQKYMKLDKEGLKIVMRKIPKFSLKDITDVCKQINNNELLKLVSSLVTFGTAIK